jgi:hypothetical protein
LEQCSPLLSHSLVGCQQDRRPFSSQPMAAGGYAERPAGTLGTLRLQTTGLLSAFNKSGVVDAAGEAAQIAMERQLPVAVVCRMLRSKWRGPEPAGSGPTLAMERDLSLRSSLSGNRDD